MSPFPPHPPSFPPILWPVAGRHVSTKCPALPFLFLHAQHVPFSHLSSIISHLSEAFLISFLSLCRSSSSHSLLAAVLLSSSHTITAVNHEPSFPHLLSFSLADLLPLTLSSPPSSFPPPTPSPSSTTTNNIHPSPSVSLLTLKLIPPITYIHHKQHIYLVNKIRVPFFSFLSSSLIHANMWTATIFSFLYSFSSPSSVSLWLSLKKKQLLGSSQSLFRSLSPCLPDFI